MNIVFFTHYTGLYGANRSLLNLVDGLQKCGHKIYVVAPAEGPVTKYLRSHNYEVMTCPFEYCHGIAPGRNEDEAISRITRQVHVIEFIKNQIVDLNIDLFYSNSSVIDIGLMISRLMKKPHIWHVREYGDLDYSLIQDLRNDGFRRLLYGAGKLVFISKTLKRHFFGNELFPQAKIIYNGVVSRQAAYEYSMRRRQRPVNKTVTFSFVGYMHPTKGQDIALAALKIIVDRGFKAKIIFAGDGPMLDSFMSLIVEWRLQDYTEVLGMVNDPFSVFIQSDAVLMCSKNEAMGRVTVEAMACSIPVIGNNSGATPELIVDGTTGLLYDGTSVNLAEKMMWCITNRSLLEKYGEYAFGHFLVNFTQEIYVKNVDDFISEVVRSNSQEHIMLSDSSATTKLELMYESILNRGSLRKCYRR